MTQSASISARIGFGQRRSRAISILRKCSILFIASLLARSVLGVSFRVADKQVIYNGPLGVALPSAVKAANGDLLVVFNTGKDAWPGSTAYIVRSTDTGKTWTQPQKLLAPVRRKGAIHTNVGLTRLKNGDLILPFADVKIRDESNGFPNPRHAGHELAFTYVLISHDNGHTWSDWVSAHAELPWSCPHGQIVEMPDGRLLLPVWMADSPQGPQDFAKDAYAGFQTSRDGGKHWGHFHRLGHFGEISLVALPDGTSLLACLKQHPSRQTFVLRSQDGGENWTSPKPIGVQGKNAVMHLSPTGLPLILCSPVREGESRPGFIYYSTDRGDTWLEGVRLLEPLPPKYPMAYGISAINLADNRMYVVFYALDPNKPEKGDSPWSSTVSYLAANLVEEKPSNGN